MAIELGAFYILEEVIGSGASGEVWRGHRRLDGLPVAVKMLKRQFARNRTVVRRFIQERDILVGLDHPNVVSVIDLVVEGGDLAIVMQLVAGGDLRQYLDEAGGRLRPELTCALLAQAAEGLAAAHAANVVHRDLKPENVLVDTGRGRAPVARITDFGVAHLAGHLTITGAGDLFGTPLYAAPEAGREEKVTAAADVYALGVMAYELVSGRPPFDAETAWSIMELHRNQTPVRPEGVSDALWEVIASCLAKDPRARPTAAALALGLRALAGDELPPVTAPRASERETVTPGPGPTRPEPDPGVHRPVPRHRIAVLALAIAALLGFGFTRIVFHWPHFSASTTTTSPSPPGSTTMPVPSTTGEVTNGPPPGTDWVAFTFDDLPIGPVGAPRQVMDTSGQGNIGVVRVLPPGLITVFSRTLVGNHAIKFPDPCTPMPQGSCPRAIVQTSDPSTLDAGDRDFTYGADVLVQPAEANPGATIIQKGRPFRTDASIWKLQVEPGGKLSCVAVAAGSGTAYRAFSTVSIADGGWHRAKCTRAGTELTIEIDSNPPVRATLPRGLSFINDAPLRLGGSSNQADNDQYSGALDNVFLRLGTS